MRERNKNAKIFLEEAMKHAAIYVNGDKAQCAAKDISSRFNDALGKLINTVFHKLSYIDTVMDEANIKAVLKGIKEAQLSLDVGTEMPNRLALNDVLDFVSMNTQRHAKTSLKTIMDRFTKAPYGFIEDDVEWLAVNSEIEEAAAAINEIMAKAKPYSEIRKLPELQKRYIFRYSDMLSQMEKPIAAAIEDARLRVMQELDGKECRGALLKKVTERFSEITEKAETCNNVATLQNIKVEADALKVRLLNEIAMEEARIIAAKQPAEPPEPSGSEERIIPPPIAPKVKIQKTISIRTINSEPTWRIETEEDVDRYVEALKKKLKQSVKNDVVLNVEF